MRNHNLSKNMSWNYAFGSSLDRDVANKPYRINVYDDGGVLYAKISGLNLILVLIIPI